MEVAKTYRMQTMPFAIGALGIVTNDVAKYLEMIEFEPLIDSMQKDCLLGAANTIRNIFRLRRIGRNRTL